MFSENGSSLRVYELFGKVRMQFTGDIPPQFDDKSLLAQLKRLVVALERQQPKEEDGRKIR